MTLSSISGSSNGTFLSRWSYVFDGETKGSGYVRLLPTSDIVFKLFLVGSGQHEERLNLAFLRSVTSPLE